METQIYNTGELRSTFPFRIDPKRDAEILGYLLQDPDIHLQSSFQQVRQHEYQGEVLVGAESVELTFHHKGATNGSRLSALRCSAGVSVAAIRLLRQVVFQNARQNTLGIQVDRPTFRAQPEQLQVRIHTHDSGKREAKSSSSIPYQESVGHAGERHFMEYLERYYPREKIEWPNATEEEGLPYDILLDGRLAFDVKATRIERSHVVLSEPEREFRRAIGRHHAIAVVTLRDDMAAPPLAIDLYTGVPLVRIDLDGVQQLLADLPALQYARPKNSIPVTAAESAPAYFIPGRYVSISATLDLKPDGRFTATGNEASAGVYEIAGHFIVLRSAESQVMPILGKLHIVTDGGSRQLLATDGVMYLLRLGPDADHGKLVWDGKKTN
ncbi:protein NO VEIN domain-containing protein [Deinococcus sp. AJ005]|uniref:protein NO VEIN domain-containing protein n=1 Tax=Deinococcus sp. AJ005 TaxID=2652443 RepID=UPI00125CAE2D|nr:DUF3883 domain-containing protein [Deinococcus sp. AJ005]QFP75447.1 DUF3883 domain-containing protein [Deinococcus sp. AJ005]